MWKPHTLHLSSAVLKCGSVHSLVTERGNSFHWGFTVVLKSCSVLLLQLLKVNNHSWKNLKCCAVVSHCDREAKFWTDFMAEKKKRFVFFLNFFTLDQTEHYIIILLGHKSDRGEEVIAQSGDTNVLSKLFYCTKSEAHNSFIHQQRRLICSLFMNLNMSRWIWLLILFSPD